uniref:Uncharacterized protein n=1 Tax=Cylindrotheca closterium TaxID=2856 RepID=A0A023IP24_9STRA|nr:hypothetical protein [Cylindrotheca closterium]AGY78404.1 hypothetical protein [Cylindrotheca closterium]
MFGSKKVGETFQLTNDILRGINATVWGGVDGAEKVGTAVKTGISGADVIIGTSHALEDFACNDPVCGTIDVIGSLSSSLGLILARIPVTKKYTTYTTSVTICCRTVRFYCRNYGTYWGCTVAAVSAAKEAVKNKLVK